MNTRQAAKEELTLPQIMSRFPDEKSAIEYFEGIRWANGVVCPHCKNNDQAKIWSIKASEEKKIRVGLRQCGVCKKQFRVTIGSIFEDSHIPLNIWLIAWYLICGAKKGMSALQLKRHLGLGSYKTAWFMVHRIRKTMQDDIFSTKLSGTVEVDETYIGGRQKSGRSGFSTNKSTVVTAVERGGQKRSVVMQKVTGTNLKQFVKENVMICSTVCTDDNNQYRGLEPKFTHKVVKHSAKEFARKEKGFNVHTNTVEGSFSLLKRGIVGSFHHVSRKHLPLYCAEFDFRWNHRKSTDGERTVAALARCGGKRLTMRGLIDGR